MAQKETCRGYVGIYKKRYKRGISHVGISGVIKRLGQSAQHSGLINGASSPPSSTVPPRGLNKSQNPSSTFQPSNCRLDCSSASRR